MTPSLSRQATPSGDVLFQEVGGEAVLLNLGSEKYFGLDAVGMRVWTLLLEDARLQPVFDSMCAEYDVEPAALESDLLALVGTMAEAGLVNIA